MATDNDITAARDVGARGIRILRAPTYNFLPQVGAFGEEWNVGSNTDRAGSVDTLPNAVFNHTFILSLSCCNRLRESFIIRQSRRSRLAPISWVSSGNG